MVELGEGKQSDTCVSDFDYSYVFIFPIEIVTLCLMGGNQRRLFENKLHTLCTNGD